MKRFSIIILTVIVALTAGTASVDAKKKTTSKKSREIYYLVINSETTLQQAIYERNNAAADWVATCPIFVAVDKDGITRYRTVFGQYSTRKAANKDKIFLREYWGLDDAWIWKSDGPAVCVEPGESYED